MLKTLQIKKSSQQGFTLMEMLIVVAIIAVLVAIAIPVFSSQLNTAKTQVDAANLRSAESMAVAQYFVDSKSGNVTYVAIASGNNTMEVTSTPGATPTYYAPEASAHDGQHIAIVVTDGGDVSSATWVNN